MDKATAMRVYGMHMYENTREFGLDGWVGWARLVDCYDGDTLTVVIQFMGECFRVRIRLAGIDAPELRGVDAAKGVAARDALIAHLTGCDSKGLTSRGVRAMLSDAVHLVWLNCGKNDKYGRVLCEVFSKAGAIETNAGAALVGGGHARPYDGGRRRTLCPTGRKDWKEGHSG